MDRAGSSLPRGLQRTSSKDHPCCLPGAHWHKTGIQAGTRTQAVWEEDVSTGILTGRWNAHFQKPCNLPPCILISNLMYYFAVCFDSISFFFFFKSGLDNRFPSHCCEITPCINCSFSKLSLVWCTFVCVCVCFMVDALFFTWDRQESLLDFILLKL